MRIVLHPITSPRDAHLLHQVQGSLHSLFLLQPQVKLHLFRYLVTDSEQNLLLDIPVRALALFPSWVWSDSGFRDDRWVWLLLTAGAVILVLAHPVRPNRATACLTLVGCIAWWVLATVTWVLLAMANC